MSITDTQVVDQDRAAASAYWNANIKPDLGGLPEDGLTFLHDSYVTSVQENPVALLTVREWYFSL